MLVACVIFALITVGLVIPCAIDIATTPSHHFDLPSKQTWLIVAIAFWVFGAAAWLLVGRREIRMRRLWDDVTGSWVSAPQMQHPAARSRRADYPFGRQRQAAMVPMRFVAPDDNPDFLVELDRRIREWRDDA
jgi:uncharacterized membrane protein